jgi:hypothetical protein
MAFYTLGQIRNVYLALHQGTDSAPSRFSSSTSVFDRVLSDPTSYPVCKVPDHHKSTSHIHHGHASTTFAPTDPGGHNNVAPGPSLPGSDPPHSSTHVSLPIDETLTDAPPVDNNISLPIKSTSDDSRISSSPSPVASCAIRGRIDTYPRTTNLFTPEPSVSALPPKSISPSDAALVKHAVGHTTFGDLNVPSSAPPALFLDDILSTGRLLPSNSNGDWN